MELEVRFTPKNRDNELPFTVVEADDKLWLYAKEGEEEYKFELRRGANDALCLFDTEGGFPFQEEKAIIEERLTGLTADWVEARAGGFEGESITDDLDKGKPGYGPDDIFFENKSFSLKQIVDLVDDGDIDISPDFQRNFIWDKTRQSRLIESIFLGLPLPSIYLSQYPDGRLTIVDGLQRISTIRHFLKDKLVLSNLEYLKECNGLKYSQLGNVLNPLRLRRFGQTQIMTFVIDYRSPSKLKFDLFRRLNTGGKPLNNQEIRNCLSRPELQSVLRSMVEAEPFRKATYYSVRDTRMEAQEAALRFMYFLDQYSEENPIGGYNGYMDDTLDDYVDVLNSRDDNDRYVAIYHDTLLCAEHLFGQYAFRKVLPNPSQRRRTPINKLLMLTVTVLLTRYELEEIIAKYPACHLLEPLAGLIADSERPLFNAITWSTNAKWNIETTFKILKSELIDKYLQ